MYKSNYNYINSVCNCEKYTFLRISPHVGERGDRGERGER
jgi:hypothetical protein